MVVKLTDEIIIESHDINKPSLANKLPALFLDRDGVVIKECHYLSNPDKVRLEKGILKLLKTAYISGWKVIVVTNQSGISKDIFSWEDYKLVTNKVIDLIGKPCPISAIYANSFLPGSEINSWRKPNPRMISLAVEKFNLDLNKSILIGDRLTDLQAGARAGVNQVIHVKTGHGFKERKLVLNNIKDGYFFDKGKKTSLLLIDSINLCKLNQNTNLIEEDFSYDK